MTFSKNSPPNDSTPSVAEQLRRQRLLEQEQESRRSSASDNPAEETAQESDSLASVAFHSFTAASAQLRMLRQLQQQSRSSEPGNEESGSLSLSGLDSSTAAPRGSQRTSSSMNDLRSILTRAIEVLDADDEEFEDVSSRRDDSNSQQ